jgi:hypothetical protein
MSRPPRRLERTLRGIAWAVLLLSLPLGYGLSAGDRAVMGGFRDAVARWDESCDFREICRVYSDLGSAAIRARWNFIDAGTWILWMRSTPGLPAHLASNDGSRGHYIDFAAGPLRAYLHLVELQGVKDMLGSFETLARRSPLSDDAIAETLRGMKLERPVTTNPDAVRSVRAMLVETDAARGFAIRENPFPGIRDHAAILAGEMGYPSDPRQMTVRQQSEVFHALDASLRRRDPELWRTKQLADLLSGVWGQSFGYTYLLLLEPTVTISGIARLVGPAVAVGLLVHSALRRRARGDGSKTPPRSVECRP